MNWQGRHRYSLKIDDSRQARRLWAVKLKEIEREVLMGTFDPGKFGFGVETALDVKPVLTFGDFAQTRLREQAGSGHTDRTQSGREHDLGAHLFSDPLSALPLFGVHAGTLEEFRGRLIAKGLKIGTINKVCGRIKSIAQEAFDRGLVDGGLPRLPGSSISVTTPGAKPTPLHPMSWYASSPRLRTPRAGCTTCNRP